MSTIPYIRTENNLSVFIDNRQYTIPLTDHRIAELENAISADDKETVRRLVNFKQTLASISANRIVFDPEKRTLTFNGQPLHHAMLDRLVTLFEQKLPIEGHLRFLDRLMDNPSFRAVNELYRFIEACDLPITPDGHFLAYKIVNHNYRDIFSNTFDNSIGATPRVARNQVDEDSDRTCSYGLHACSRAYLPHYGCSDGRIMVVKIDPADVVAVPRDYNNAKLRCCGYEVVAEIPREEAFAGLGMDRYHTDNFGTNEVIEEDLEDELFESDYDDSWENIGVDDFYHTPIAEEGTKPTAPPVNTKLTEQQVRDIDRLLKDGELSIAAIGRLYNVNESTIRKIRDGLIWSHITGRYHPV